MRCRSSTSTSFLTTTSLFPIASVGAPTILTEKWVLTEFTKLIDMVGSYYGKKITAIMPIGLAA